MSNLTAPASVEGAPAPALSLAPAFEARPGNLTSLGAVPIHRLLPRAGRRALRTRWRKPRRRAVPSPSAMADWLARFHDAAAGQPRPPGSAIIPAMAEPIRALWQINQARANHGFAPLRLDVAVSAVACATSRFLATPSGQQAGFSSP